MSKNKASSKSSKAWLKAHFSDQYVKASQKAGYRSRAIYKLISLQEKDHLLKPGQVVVDLGAAPGGWSQYAAEAVQPNGRVFALDCLMMDPINHVEFLQGDFTQDDVLEAFLAQLGDDKVDVVLSDLAPNFSGMNAVDQPRSIYLAEIALDFALRVLSPGGSFAAKVFQGDGFDAFHRELRQHFSKVVTRKPPASRARSREVYLVGKNRI